MKVWKLSILGVTLAAANSYGSIAKIAPIKDERPNLKTDLSQLAYAKDRPASVIHVDTSYVGDVPIPGSFDPNHPTDRQGNLITVPTFNVCLSVYDVGCHLNALGEIPNSDFYGGNIAAVIRTRAPADLSDDEFRSIRNEAMRINGEDPTDSTDPENRYRGGVTVPNIDDLKPFAANSAD